MSSSTPERGANNPFRHVQPRVPTSVQVIAILHLVFGGLSFVSGLCNGAIQAIGQMKIIPQPPAPPPGAKMPVPPDLGLRLQRFLEESVPFYTGMQITQMVLSLVLSVLMVVAGIGLLGMRPWARKLSLIYGVASIVYQLVLFAYMIAFTLPATNQFYEQIQKEFPGTQLFVFAQVGTWAALAFLPVGLIYPTVVLVVLTRRKVVAAFAGELAEPPPDHDRREDRGGSSTDVFAR